MAAVWSEWSEWSNCTKCSNFEFSYRTRKCKTPFTRKRIITSLKNECNGNNKELTRCKNCPDNTTNYFEWSSWSECSAKSCGNGTRSRWKKLMAPSKLMSGDGSEIVLERSVCTFNSEKCQTTDKAWSDWSSWSNCSKNCGQGFTFRKRICQQSFCDGLSNEIKFCVNNIECKEELTQKNEAISKNDLILNQTSSKNEWSGWSQWSQCNGVSFFKTRKCLENGEVVSNFKCQGLSFITSNCTNNTSFKSNIIIV